MYFTSIKNDCIFVSQKLVWHLNLLYTDCCIAHQKDGITTQQNLWIARFSLTYVYWGQLIGAVFITAVSENKAACRYLLCWSHKRTIFFGKAISTSICLKATLFLTLKGLTLHVLKYYMSEQVQYTIIYSIPYSYRRPITSVCNIHC